MVPMHVPVVDDAGSACDNEESTWAVVVVFMYVTVGQVMSRGEP